MEQGVHFGQTKSNLFHLYHFLSGWFSPGPFLFVLSYVFVAPLAGKKDGISCFADQRQAFFGMRGLPEPNPSRLRLS
jgi:hypothetical protein